MSIEATLFKQVMRRFATGVMVLTTPAGEGWHAVTVNAVTSLSLDPTLMLVCIENNAQSHRLVHESGVFALNILSDKQVELGRLFAFDRGARSHPLDFVDATRGETGALIFRNALAYLECRVTTEYAGGDHTIFIGEVTNANVLAPGDGALLYYEGQFKAAV